MMKRMMHRCCGPDGRPDFDKMTEFMEQEDRSSLFDAIGWGWGGNWSSLDDWMHFSDTGN